MRTVDVDLLGRVFEGLMYGVISAGEPFVITRDGIAVARLEPIAREPIDLDWGATGD